ncbi:unnamed protein product [Pocillopora meandrina]|uniref:Uncharacterized protein n=1 Tax=Pocillopora meandrina TaxID=46732 RepID=A0AAU9X1L7_9CNID|nr:unnamed protein product [Pocillopora meandrina]
MLQRLPADFHVTLLGKKVTPSPSARDLGLQADSTLSYDEHGLAPSYLCHRFKTHACVHDHNTRYKNNLNTPAYKSAYGQRTFFIPCNEFLEFSSM